jgi:putative copper export protein
MWDAWLFVRALHLVAMAFFVGGQLLLAVAVVPVERSSPDPDRTRAIARRFAWGTLVAIGVLLLTGASLATHFHRWGDGTLHLKLAFVAIVGGLILWHLGRPQLRALDGPIFLASLVIVWLGVALAH